MSEDYGVFAVRLRALRQAAGFSQQDLADHSGLSVRAISNLERGRTRWPYRDSLERLADSLALAGTRREDFIAVGRRPLPAAHTPVDEYRATADAGAIEHAEQGSTTPLGTRPTVPRHLPAAVPGFVGREEAIAQLTRLLPPQGSMSVVAISGTAGVGKTALAVRWVYALAYGSDVLGPGSTVNQDEEMTRVGSPVPGDLVSFGPSLSSSVHVGIYIGNNQMIDEPAPGNVVRTDTISSAFGNILGYFKHA